MNDLEMNRGRREGKEWSERWCRCCGWEVEDERHFMLACEEFDGEREDMMANLDDLNGMDGKTKERAEGGDYRMMDMLIGRGIEGKYEEGMKIVQEYVKRSMRRRKGVVG